MPIQIYRDSFKEIGHLCEEDWELPGQVYALEKWLKTEGCKLPKGHYVADIGFCPREGATGGGGVINVKMMEIMVEIGMEVFLSEYPG